MTFKNIIILIIVFTCSIELIAQSDSDSQTDSLTLYTYIDGKPDLTYVEAKKQIAKDLGLRTEFFYGDCGGTFNYKASEFKVKNKPAFDSLRKIYGADWVEQFENEVNNLRDKIYKN